MFCASYYTHLHVSFKVDSRCVSIVVDTCKYQWRAYNSGIAVRYLDNYHLGFFRLISLKRKYIVENNDHLHSGYRVVRYWKISSREHVRLIVYFYQLLNNGHFLRTCAIYCTSKETMRTVLTGLTHFFESSSLKLDSCSIYSY